MCAYLYVCTYARVYACMHVCNLLERCFSVLITASDTMNRRPGAHPSDDEIQTFVEEWDLSVFGPLRIGNVSRDILGVALRTFHTTLDLEDYDAEFTKHAMLLE